MKNKVIFILLFALFVLANPTEYFAQRDLGVRPTSSGGVLMPEQAAYDIKSYDLELRSNIEEQSIKGVLTATAKIVNPIDKFVLDLDAPFTVESVSLVNGAKQQTLTFERREGQIWIAFPKTQKAGETVNVRVVYGGKPRVAARPPWVGGFVWSKTADGQPWFATAVQNDGSDLWFPVKDHPSDKPETTSLHFTVPNNLVAASNGKLQSVVKNSDGTQTFNWFVSQPISNYNIALNVAPYKLVEDKMQSIAGDMIPIAFYVLPEHADKAQDLINKTKDYVRFFEEYLGPYPFRADKLGIAETPHLGMEHQSITAYGNEFKYDPDGVDTLMFHELGHEWWANLVTAKDWNDFWIHESFQSFMDALYKERLKGRESFVKSLPSRIKSLKNIKPVAPREPRTTVEMYMLPPDYTRSDNDIYGKGALVLNSLRSLIGDAAFFKSLRRMAYLTPEMEKVTNGKQTRLVTTDEFIRIAERQSGKKLDWFFELYVRQPALPRLIAETKANNLVLRWETPNNMPFPMPVEVKIGGETKRVEMTNNSATVALPQDAQYTIDPNGWLLKSL
ncbi:MAG TPA: M1 family metallopeptidase [Pyrinomonadaceae bacterium]|jgi:aminopeptidase N